MNKHGILSHFSDLDIQYLERCSRFVKAIDTRLKEIKVTRMYATEDEPKSVPEVQRGKKKNKSIMKNQTRNKKIQEMQNKLNSYDKKSSRIMKQQKKKFKNEFNDLRTVEEKFFETVEKVISSNSLRILSNVFWKQKLHLLLIIIRNCELMSEIYTEIYLILIGTNISRKDSYALDFISSYSLFSHILFSRLRKISNISFTAS